MSDLLYVNLHLNAYFKVVPSQNLYADTCWYYTRNVLVNDYVVGLEHEDNELIIGKKRRE
jgi:hypothetical protein